MLFQDLGKLLRSLGQYIICITFILCIMVKWVNWHPHNFIMIYDDIQNSTKFFRNRLCINFPGSTFNRYSIRNFKKLTTLSNSKSTRKLVNSIEWNFTENTSVPYISTRNFNSLIFKNSFNNFIQSLIIGIIMSNTHVFIIHIVNSILINCYFFRPLPVYVVVDILILLSIPRKYG